MKIMSYQGRKKTASLVVVLMLLQLLTPAGLVLAEPGSETCIYGFVKDSGEPVEDVFVRLNRVASYDEEEGEWWNGNQVRTLYTDAEGYYEFTDVPADDYVLQFQHGSYANFETFDGSVIQLAEGQILGIDIVELVPDVAGINGVVTDADTGDAIEGVWVVARISDGAGGWNWATGVNTSFDGSYTFNSLQPGDYKLEFSHNFYDNFDTFVDGEELAFELTAGEVEKYDQELNHIGRGDITGTVIDAVSFDPIEGVAVSVPAHDPVLIETETDVDGNYTLSDVPEGWRNVSFSHEDFVNASQWVSVLADDSVVLNSSINPLTIISGIATNADTGEPVDNVRVRAYRITGYDEEEWWPTWDWQQVLTENGHYEFALENAGEYVLEFTHDFFEEYDTFTDEDIGVIEIALGGEEEIDVSLTPDAALGAVSGTVTCSIDNEPVEGVNVQVATDHGTFTVLTDEAGEYDRGNIPAGTWNVFYSHDMYINLQTEALIEDGETTEKDKTMDMFYIKGMVVDASAEEDGELEGIRATLYGYDFSWGEGNWSWLDQVTTDEEGRYNFFNLNDDISWYYIVFECDSEHYETKNTMPFYAAVREATEEDVALSHRGLADVSGTVTDGITEETIENAKVTISYFGETDYTAADGSYSFTDIPAGEWDIIFEKAGYRTIEKAVNVEEGDDNEFDAILWDRGVKGRVTDSSTGSPVPGADVVLTETDSNNGEAAFSGTTNCGGYYLFNGVPEGEWDVTIVAEGYHAEIVSEVVVNSGDFADAGETELDPRLISGKVTDADGDAIGGVTVTTESISGIVYEDETDTAGEYTLSYVPAGNWFISFNHENYHGKEIMVEVDEDAEDVDVQLALSKGDISGTVTEAGTEDDPLEGINVILQRFAGNWANTGLAATTDADGEYDFTYLDPGFYRLVIDDPEFAAATTAAFYLGEAEDVTADVELSRLHYGSVTGTVFDAEEASVEAVQVNLLYNGETFASVSTDADGAFEFADVPVGTWALSFSHVDYFDKVIDNENVAKDAENDLGEIKLSLKTYGDISGNVTDALSEEGIWDVYVVAESEGDSYSTWSDAEGNYTFEGIPAGTYTVTFSHGWYQNAEKSVTVEDGEAADGDIKLNPRHIEGQVTDTDEEGIAGVTVRLWEYDAENDDWNIEFTTTDAEGNYIIRGLPDDVFWFRLDFSHNDYNYKAVAPFFLNEGEVKEKDVTLEPDVTLKGNIEGKVTDAETGEGIPGLRVRTGYIFEIGGRITAFTDAEGNYELKDVPEGTRNIEFRLFRDPSHGNNRLFSYYYYEEEVEVIGEETAELNAYLNQLVTGDIAGTVTDAGMEGDDPRHAEGDPLYDVRVRFVNLDIDGLTRTTWTNQDGEYSMNFLPAGNWQVTFTHNDYHTVVIEEIEISQDETIVLDEVVMELNKGYISGTVTDSDTGYPLEGAYVQLNRHHNTGFWQSDGYTTGRDGYYEFKSTPGFYHLVISHPDYDESRTLIFFLNEKEEKVMADRALDPAEQPGYGGIYGNITDSSTGEPLADVFVNIEGLSPEEDPVIFNNNNTGGVQNDPWNPTVFTLEESRVITYIETYHYFNQGTPPGTIWLEHNDGTTYGPWQASGRVGQGGVQNAYWEVWPNVAAKAGTYTIQVSSPETWSHNWQSNYRGFAKVEGQVGQYHIYTDSNGEYVLEGVPDGIWTLTITPGDYYIDKEIEIEVKDGKAGKVDIALDPWYIAGTVTDAETEEPLEDAWVRLYQYDVYAETLTLHSGVNCDEEGAFSFGNLEEAGWYVLRVSQYPYQEYYSLPFFVKEGQPVDDLAIGMEVYDEYGSITVTVSDSETGEVIEGVIVKDWEQTAYTSADGKHTFADVPAGEYTLTFKHFAYHTTVLEEIVVTENEEINLEVDLVPEALGDISGTVTDAVTGEPVQGVHVSTEQIEIEGTTFDKSIGTFTDAEGEYTLNGVPAGAREITFSRINYEEKVAEVNVEKGETAEIDKELQPLGGTVSGFVSAEGTDPEEFLEGVMVRLQPPDSAGLEITYTDEDGFFEFRFVEKGFYRLTYYHVDYVWATTLSFYVGDKADVEYNQALTPTDEVFYGTVYGVVTGEDGDPVAGANIHVEGYSFNLTQTNEFGEFLLEDALPVGKWNIIIEHKYYVNGEVEVSVEKDAVTEIEAELDDWYITGTVSSSGLLTDALALLLRYSALTDSWSVVDIDFTCEEGTYILGNLSEDAWYMIVFEADGYNEQTTLPFQVTVGDIKTKYGNLSASVINGTVTDVDDNPLEGVAVRVLEDPECTTYTAEDGSYKLEGLNAGTWTIEYKHPDYHRTRVEEFQLGKYTELLEVALVPALFGDISGTVTDEVSGEPLSGVKVDLGTIAIEGTTFSESYISYTDVDGEYLITGIPEGDWDVSFTRQNYYASEMVVEVSDGDTTVIENVELEPKFGAITGKITAATDAEEAEEEIIEGVTVRLYKFSGTNWNYTSQNTTDEDGIYGFATLSPGFYRLSFSHSDYLDVEISSFFVDKGMLAEKDMVLTALEDVPVGSIFGIVTDIESEEPVQNVDVTVNIDIEGLSNISTQTNANGQYILEGVPVGEWEILFDHNNYVDLVSTVEVEECQATTADAALQPWYITGTVTDADTEEPIYSARARLIKYDEDNDRWVFVRNAWTDEEGNYRLGGLKNTDARWFMIQFDKAGYQSSATLPFIAKVEDITFKDSVLTPWEYGTISGTVYDAVPYDEETYVPIHGVKVRTENIPDYGVIATFTDGEGNFTLNDVPAGNWNLDLSHEDYYDKYLDDVEVVGGEDNNLGDLYMNLGIFGGISGTVTDEATGLPVYNALVETEDIEGLGVFSGTTDDEGLFTLIRWNGSTNIPVGTWEVTVSRYEYYESVFEITVVEEAVTEATLELAPKVGNVTGTVTDEDGNPLFGVDVALQSMAYGWNSGVTYFTETCDDGVFELNNMSVGYHRLKFSHPNYLGEVTSAFYIGESETAEINQELTLRNFADVTGAVEDADGNPIEGAFVRLYDGLRNYYYDTEEDGTFFFRDIPSGLHVIYVSHSMYINREVDIEVGEDDDAVEKDIVLEPWFLSGTAAEDEEPVEGVMIKLLGYDSSWDNDISKWYVLDTVFTNEDGYYEIGGFESLDQSCYHWFALQVGKKGYEPFVTLPFTVPAGEKTVKDLSLALLNTGEITGTVTDSVTEEPLAGVKVRTENMYGYGSETTFTDDEGAFSMTDVPVGIWEVEFTHADYYTVLQTEVEVENGETTDLGEISLDEITFGSISGFVTDAVTGEPLENAVVTTDNVVDVGMTSVSTDEDGYFEMEKVPAGSRTLLVEKVNYHEKEINITVEDGAETELNVELAPTYGVVSGTVTDIDSGDALHSVDVILERLTQQYRWVDGRYQWVWDWSNSSSVQTDDEGAYLFNFVQPGMYRLSLGHINYLYTESDEFYVGEGRLIESDFEMELWKPGDVEGTVTDSVTGEAVEGVELVLITDAYDLFSDVTDIAGEYFLEEIPAGLFEVNLTHEDYHEITAEVEVMGGKTVTLDLQMLPLATIAGTVTDEEGEPISDVEVSIKVQGEYYYDEYYYEYKNKTYTDYEGNYELEGVTEGITVVQFRHPDYLPVTEKVNAFGGEETELNVEMVFKTYGAVSGNITGVDGEPLEGVSVYAENVDMEWGTDNRGNHTYTDEDGNYLFNKLHTGNIELSYWLNGYHSVSRYIHLEEGDDVTIDVTMVEVDGITADLDLTVKNAEGQAIEGIRVRVIRQDRHVNPFAAEINGWADENGLFEKNVPVGYYLAEFADVIPRDNGKKYENYSCYIEVTEDGLSKTVTLQEADYITGDLTGIIKDAKTGDPVPFAEVSIGWPYSTVTTKADGSFLIENVTEGVWRVNCRHEDYKTYNKNVFVSFDAELDEQKEFKVDFDLNPLEFGNVAGNVVFNGEPVSQVGVFYDVYGETVHRYVYEEPQSSFALKAVADKFGDYNLNRVPTHVRYLRFEHHDHPIKMVRVDVKPDENNVVNVELEEYGSLSGRVVDFNRAALEGVLVTATNKLTNEKDMALTDENGRFTMDRVAPGTNSLSFSHDAYRFRTVDIQVRVASGQAKIMSEDEIVLEKYSFGRVEGQVIHPRTGEPSEGVRVTLVTEYGDVMEAETDSDGRFIFTDVPSGNVIVGYVVPGLVVDTFEPMAEFDVDYEKDFEVEEDKMISLEPTEGPDTRLPQDDDPYTLGDVNGDGAITVADAILVLRYIVGLVGEDGIIVGAADVNRDGSITVADAILILRYIVGLVEEF